MFKVISSEIKKMVSKPGIYVLAAFLAVILVLGVFIYKPQVRSSTDVSNRLEANGYTYDNYSSIIKQPSNNSIQKTVDAVKTYSNTYNEQGALVLDGYVETYKLASTELFRSVNSSNKEDMRAAADAFVNSINAIKNYLGQNVYEFTSDGGQSYAIFTSDSNIKNFKKCTDDIIVAYNGLSAEGARYEDFYIDFVENYKDNFESCISKYYFPKLSAAQIINYSSLTDEKGRTTKYGTVTKRLQEIDEKIVNLFENVSGALSYENGKKFDEFVGLINDYNNTTNSYLQMVKFELLSNAFDSLKTKDQFILTDSNNETEFSANTYLTRYTYLFNRNKVAEDFANPLAVGTTIGTQKSGYDYAYFILKLFSIVILAYAIMSACHTIAGEIKEGSMRYFAIRPISRGEILFGKLLSIIIMSSIILLFSAVIALAVGGGVYGLTANNILTIFNGDTALVIHPMAMLALYLLSFVVQIVIYASIALMLSTLIKSDLLSTTIMLLIYILNLLLPVFAGGMNSWLAFYPFSHISLFALFGSSLFANSNDLLSKLLAENVYAGTSLLTIGVVSLVLIVVPLIIAKLAFKNKEL